MTLIRNFQFCFCLLTFLFSPLLSWAQTSYRNLVPGQTMRIDVEKLLGTPVESLSDTLQAYKSESESEKIYVQYRKEPPIAERIEILFRTALQSPDLAKIVKIPEQATASESRQGKLLEYYDSPAFVVLTYASPEKSSGVRRVGFYSKELFQKAIAKVDKTDSKGLGPDQVGWGFNNQIATILTYYGSTSAATCRADCEKNPKCMAYSWIKPSGILPGDPPMCYLMSAWIKMMEHPCCISAVRN